MGGVRADAGGVCAGDPPSIPQPHPGPAPCPCHVNPRGGRGSTGPVGYPGTMGYLGSRRVRGKGGLGKPMAWLAAGRAQAWSRRRRPQHKEA